MYDRDYRHVARLAQLAWKDGQDDVEAFLQTSQEDIEILRQENRWHTDREQD